MPGGSLPAWGSVDRDRGPVRPARLYWLVAGSWLGLWVCLPEAGHGLRQLSA